MLKRWLARRGLQMTVSWTKFPIVSVEPIGTQTPEEAEAEYQNAEPVDCIAWPLETRDSQLVLRIPLSQGGDKLVGCTRGISRIENETLVVMIPNWMALDMNLASGMIVTVGRKGRRFAMWLPEPLAGQDSN